MRMIYVSGASRECGEFRRLFTNSEKLVRCFVLMLDNARRSYGEKSKEPLINYLRLIKDSRHKIETNSVLSIKRIVRSMHAIEDRD